MNWNFEPIANSAYTAKTFGLRKDPEYLYQLFRVLSNQIICETKIFQIEVYIQQ